MDPFLGEIRAVPYNFAPYGWLDCDGQILSIAQYSALFSLIGTTYGGNGTSNFALPNLQDCVAMGQGQGPGLSEVILGEKAGEASVTILASEMPAHNHGVAASTSAGTASNPSNAVFAKPQVAARLQNLYHGSGGAHEAVQAVGLTGSGLPHTNLQPFLAVRYVIAINGIYPSRG